MDAALLAQLQAEALHLSFLCDAVAFVVPDAGFRFSVQRWLPLGA